MSTITEGRIICMKLQDLHEARKPAITLTGHVQGPTAEMSKENLQTLMDAHCRSKGLKGVIKIVGKNKTNTGVILVLQTDQLHHEEICTQGNLISMGCAGQVLFSEKKGKGGMVHQVGGPKP